MTSLRGESNDQRQFDSTKQSVESKRNLNGLLRRELLRFATRMSLRTRNDVLKNDVIRVSQVSRYLTFFFKSLFEIIDKFRHGLLFIRAIAF